MSMLVDEQASLLEEFITETTEHLATAEECLLQLEEAPNQPGTVRELMRVFHTIKGNSGYFGFREMSRLSHELETQLTAVQRGEATLDETVMAELLAGVDRLKQLLHETRTATGPSGAVVAVEAGRQEESGGTERYLIFQVGAIQMALPIGQVLEVTRPSQAARLPYVRDHVAGVVNLRGLLVPLVDLERKLWGQTGLDQAQHVVVVPWGSGRVALAVRQVVAVLEIERVPAATAGCERLGSHQIILHQGTPVALLDLQAVLGDGAVDRRRGYV
jgi:chemotaxis protein histidine kinase CheA